MAELSRRRSNGETVFESYIHNKEDWDRYNNDVLTFRGPAGGKDFPIYKDNNDLSPSLEMGKVVKLIDNKQRMVTIKGRSTPCAHFEQGTVKGWCPIQWISYKAKDFEKKQNVAMDMLSAAIQERMVGGEGICIFFRNRNQGIGQVYKNVTGIKKIVNGEFGVRYDPKSDFALMSGRQHVCHISHKDKGGPKAYQQYAGLTREADFGRTGILSEHPEVLAFLEDALPRYNEIQNNRVRFRRYVESDELAQLAIFGPEFGRQNGVNNVHVMAQGDPILIPSDGAVQGCGMAYELQFSEDHSLDGDLTHFKTRGYRAVIGVRYGELSRKVTYQGREYRRLRALIGPEDLLRTAEFI